MKMKSIAATMILSIAGSSQATQKTVVPAFFAVSTNTNGTTADWTRIANKGSAVLAVVPLGGSGGFETCGPGTCSVTDARTQFVANHNAGQLVLGYVLGGFACTSTGNLSTSLTSFKSGAYGVSKWYSTSEYPTQIDGIFVDVGPQSFNCSPGTDLSGQSPQSQATQQSYYSQAYSYVVTNHAGAKVMLNASQYENEWIVATGSNKSADYAVIFEKNYTTWSSSYKAGNNTTPGWWTSGYQGKLANVIYGTTQYHVAPAVSSSQGSTYGSPPLYLYDGDSKGYDHLSCSFETQVALLQGTTPVPAATTYCSGGCTDLDSDSNNCGACGNYCDGYQSCYSGSCWIDCGQECYMKTREECAANCN